MILRRSAGEGDACSKRVDFPAAAETVIWRRRYLALGVEKDKAWKRKTFRPSLHQPPPH